MKWLNETSGLIETVIVVAGGVDTDFMSMSSVELLFVDRQNLSGSKFTVGPEMLIPLQQGVMVAFESSVVYTGGFLHNETVGQLYNLNLFQLTNPQGPWTVMTQTLKEARESPVAFLVSDDVANTCN